MKYRFLLLVSLLLFSRLAFAQTAEQLYIKADSLVKAGKYEQALKSVDAAIKLNSQQSKYYRLKAFCQTQNIAYVDALETLTEAIRLFPNQGILYDDRGNLLLRVKLFEKAMQDFSKALQLETVDSLRCSYYVNRSAARSYVRDFQGAYFDLMEALKIDSNDLGALTNLGAVCDDLGKDDEALNYLLRAVAIDSTFYPAYGNIGFKMQQRGRHREAITYFDKIAAWHPEEPLAYSNRSYSKLKLGDLDGALSDINKSLKLYPANSYAYWVRAQIYLEQHKTGNACDDIQTALDKGYTKSYGDAVLKLQQQHCQK